MTALQLYLSKNRNKSRGKKGKPSSMSVAQYYILYCQTVEETRKVSLWTNHMILLLKMVFLCLNCVVVRLFNKFHLLAPTLPQLPPAKSQKPDHSDCFLFLSVAGTFESVVDHGSKIHGFKTHASQCVHYKTFVICRKKKPQSEQTNKQTKKMP